MASGDGRLVSNRCLLIVVLECWGNTLGCLSRWQATLAFLEWQVHRRRVMPGVFVPNCGSGPLGDSPKVAGDSGSREMASRQADGNVGVVAPDSGSEVQWTHGFRTANGNTGVSIRRCLIAPWTKGTSDNWVRDRRLLLITFFQVSPGCLWMTGEAESLSLEGLGCSMVSETSCLKGSMIVVHSWFWSAGGNPDWSLASGKENWKLVWKVMNRHYILRK